MTKMDEQKLNEAADKLCSARFGTMQGMIKYGDIYIQGVLAGAYWQESQNQWRKQDNHPDIDNVNVYRSKTVIAKSNQYNEPIIAIYDYNLRLWRSYPHGNPIFTITEWKYID